MVSFGALPDQSLKRWADWSWGALPSQARGARNTCYNLGSSPTSPPRAGDSSLTFHPPLTQARDIGPILRSRSEGREVQLRSHKTWLREERDIVLQGIPRINSPNHPPSSFREQGYLEALSISPRRGKGGGLADTPGWVIVSPKESWSP